MPVRIYELTREFNLTTKEVLAACREAGLVVKSHSSTIEDDEAAMVRRRLSVLAGDTDEPERAAVAAPPEPAAALAPPPPPPVPLPSPEEQLARARSMHVLLPTRGPMKPKAEGAKLPGRRPPPARPAAEAPAPAQAEAPAAEAPAQAPPGAAEAAPAAAVAEAPSPAAESAAAAAEAGAAAPAQAPAGLRPGEAGAAEEAAAETRERLRTIRKAPRPKLAPKPKLAPRPKLAPKPGPHPQAVKEPEAPRPHPQAVGVGAPKRKRAEPRRPEKPKPPKEAARGPAAPPAAGAPGERRTRRRGRKAAEEEAAEGLRKAQAFRRRERIRKREDMEDASAAGDTILSPTTGTERTRIGRGGRIIMTRPATRPAPRPRPPAEGPKKAAVELPVTVKSLSAALGVKAGGIITKLMAQGALATVNDTLTEEQALEIALGYETELEIRRQRRPEDVLRDLESQPDSPEALLPRSPVVVFMGHVDHGKTTLMDYIRKSHVAAGEAGGITQHIGAYRAKVGERWITFLDTPGHAAFTAMRARGAKVTDVAVLVVAADDGVMPQTEEAVNHARAAEVPIVVAINKCDLPQANPLRVKQQLATLGLQTEEWGGKTICAEVSATTGQNVDKLLESLLLEAEMRELRANPDRPALGTVIEAQLTEGFGPLATLLVQNGTLHTGDVVLAGTAYGRVRVLTDETKRRMREAGPAVPVRVAGLSEVPEAGDRFHVVEDLSLAKQLAEDRQRQRRQAALAFGAVPRTLEAVFQRMTAAKVKELPVIIKADVQGSVEALRENLEKIEHPEVRVRVIHAGTGGITESDVLLADASNAIIIGFGAVPDPQARVLAEARGVDIRQYQIIYDVTDDVRKALEGMLAPKEQEHRLGECNVVKTFKISRVGTVAGCMVTDGVIARSARVRLVREGRIVFTGAIQSLKRVKDDAREVRSGQECGIHLAGYNDVKVGDRIEAFETVSVARTLE
ncbi:MAG: translation initiation factor IF-2 [Planctomycetes bacterium]|nr:translation initiation factor IF-2 [Planctomycetota bacterium]